MWGLMLNLTSGEVAKRCRLLNALVACGVGLCAGHVSSEDRSSLFFDRLARKVKHQLFATKKESPEFELRKLLNGIFTMHI